MRYQRLVTMRYQRFGGDAPEKGAFQIKMPPSHRCWHSTDPRSGEM